MTRCTRCSGDILDLAVFCPGCGQPHEPDFDQLLRRSLSGRYEIYNRLGSGGLSTVFEAIDTHTEQVVVVKVSDPRQLVQHRTAETCDSAELSRYWAEMLGRMRREVVALVSVHHPNIVRIFDTDQITEELRYIIMERLDGRTLREELSTRSRLPLREALRLTEAITDGLGVVHARGIIHRDLNPRNLFLCENSPESGLKIIDFGIAKIPQPPGTPPFTQYAVLSGTVSYASPEQCQNLPIDHRSDIYSLGVVLYEMLTGQRPFTGLTPTEIALRQVQAAPVRPSVIVPDLPSGVEIAILRALAKDPDSRQQSVEELAADLLPYKNGYTARVVVPLTGFATRPAESLSAILGSLPGTAPVVDASPVGAAANALANAAPPSAEAQAIPATVKGDAADDRVAPDFQLTTIEPVRRRKPLAAAAVALLLILAGTLYGSQLLSTLQSYFAPASPAEPVTARADAGKANAAAAVTDAGTLKSMARRLGNSILSPTASPAPTEQATPGVTATPRQPFVARPGLEHLIVSVSPAPSPLTLKTGAPPFAQPQMPPVPAPTIAVSRDPQPQSNPAEARGPVRDTTPEESAPAWPNDNRANPPARVERSVPPVSRETDDQRSAQARPDYQREPARRDPRKGERPSEQRDDQSNDTRRGNDEPDDSPVNADYAPKVITWSGEVNQEREVRLELPGVPGNINIPRQYRRRVGMVEPPGPRNKWRCVVLRVFGNGHTSVVVQWWPSARQFGQSAGNFLNRQVVVRFDQASRAVARQFSRIRP